MLQTASQYNEAALKCLPWYHSTTSATRLFLFSFGGFSHTWKEIQPVHSKGDQSWVFFGRTDAKAETPVLWPPHAKSWLIGKDPDAGRDWGQEEKGTTEDEMAEMASLTRWTWVWVNSGSWWWTGRPGVLRFMRSQRVRHDWATELNWKQLLLPPKVSLFCFFHL